MPLVVIDFWDRFNDPSLLDNVYETEFGEDENHLNHLYEQDDDDDPYKHRQFESQAQSQQVNSQFYYSQIQSQTHLDQDHTGDEDPFNHSYHQQK